MYCNVVVSNPHPPEYGLRPQLRAEPAEYQAIQSPALTSAGPHQDTSKKTQLKRSPSVEPPRRAASKERSPWIRSTVERSYQKPPPVQRKVALLKQRSYIFVVFTAIPTAATATRDQHPVPQQPQEAVIAKATSSNE